MTTTEINTSDFFAPPMQKFRKVNFGGDDPGVDAPPPGAAPAPLGTIVMLDRSAVLEVDPLFPKIFVLVGAPVEAKELQRDGKTVATLIAAEPGKVTLDLSLEGYEWIVDQLGSDDTGEVCDRWLVEGEAEMRHVIRDPPSGPLRSWRGEPEVRARQAEAVGRSYGMPAAAIAAVTGRPYTPRRSLLPTADRAHALDEQKRVADQAEAEAKTAAEAARIEAARPKSLAELGVEVITCEKARATSNDLADHMPYRGARLLGQDAGRTYWGFQRVQGLDLPEGFEQLGVRVLRQTDIVPPFLLPAPEANVADASFAKTIRARSGGEYDLGPIAASRFTDRGLDLARGLVKRFRRGLVVFSPNDPFAWRSLWLVEAIVRGVLIRPDVAAHLVVSERNLMQAHAEELQSDPLSDVVASQAVLFAARGDISAGSLLEPEPAATTLHATTKSKNAKKDSK
jgi:hypothetical protein